MATSSADLIDVQRSRHLPHDADAIWAVLARFGQIREWAPKVTHSVLTTEQAEDVGTARRVQVGRQALIETVTLWEPERTLAYTIEGLPPVVEGVTNRWDLGVDQAGTFVTLTSIIAPGSSAKGKAAARILRLPLGKASDGMLDGLTAFLATGAA